MDETVNNIINNIAEKLGIAVEYIVPALVRYNIAEDLIHLIWATVWIIGIIITSRMSIKFYKDNKDKSSDAFENPLFVIPLICCILFIFFAIFKLADGLDIIKWIMAPEGATINYILDKVKS